jgi:hypothetical protein
MDLILTLEAMFMQPVSGFIQPVSKTHLSHLATAPLSVLLRRLGVAMSAHEANHILVEQGYLMNLYRPSLKHAGQTRMMRVLTRKGLLFGKNCGSPVHPLHSSPQFYAELFELLWAQVVRDAAVAGQCVQSKAA